MKLNWQQSIIAMVLGTAISGNVLADSTSVDKAHVESQHSQSSTHAGQQQSIFSESTYSAALDVESYPFKEFHALIIEDETQHKDFHASL